MSSTEVRFRRSGRALSRTVGDEVLITVAGDGDVVSLFETGRAIWELLDSPSSISELANTLGSRYGSPSEEIWEDIDKFVQKLVQKRVVERNA